jgi:hypothetical protein
MKTNISLWRCKQASGVCTNEVQHAVTELT